MSNYELLVLGILFVTLISTLEWKISIERSEFLAEQEKEKKFQEFSKPLTREQELEKEVERLNTENARLAQENAKKGFR